MPPPEPADDENWSDFNLARTSLTGNVNRSLTLMAPAG
jgi:hypothetical protein